MEEIKFRNIEWLDYYLTEEKPGAFLLSNDGEVPLVVGWSDENLLKEIKKRTETVRGIDHPFSYFWCQYCETAYEAFSLHCKLWHRFSFSGPHPQSNGRGWRCPICEKEI